MEQTEYLKLKRGKIAYRRIKGKGPGIVFMGGFRSDMTGTKAMALETFCRERGQAFVCFDYRGHGRSSGHFEDGTIGMWKEDALTVLEKLTRGPQLLVGSSMGGWIALLAACGKPRRVAGIIGIAPAPDFTEHLIWEKLNPKQQQEVKDKGWIMVPSEYGKPFPITRDLIADGRKHLILDAEIPIFCPVRLLHGMKDAEVPWEISLALNEKIASQDVRTILVENGDHRLSTPKDIEKLLRVTAKMLDAVK